MNNGEWWIAVHKAAQYWQEVRNNPIGVAGSDLLRTTDGGRTDSAKSPAKGSGNERDKRGA